MPKIGVPKPTSTPKVRKPLKRKGTPTPVNRTRKAAEFARCYGSKERVAWVCRQRCVCFDVGACLTWRCHNAHIEGDGMGRKAAASKIIPLCMFHYQQLHKLGRAKFEQAYALDLAVLARQTERAWRSHAQPEQP